MARMLIVLTKALLALAAIWTISNSPRVHSEVTTTYVGGIPISRAEVAFSEFQQNYEAQEKSQWCWAASIANIFRFHGYPVAQSRIVEAVYGSTVNMPALTGRTIAQQLNREWIDDNGRKFRAKLTAAFDADAGLALINNHFMINELKENRPFIVCNTHHCMVATAIEFDPFNVRSVGVFDPWPLSTAARGLSLEEMTLVGMRTLRNTQGQLRFLAAVTVTPVSSSTSKGPTSSSAKGTSASRSFDTFFGLKQGDDMEKVRSVFGEPDETKEGTKLEFWHYTNYHIAVSFRPETGKINHIKITLDDDGDNLKALKEAGLEESKLKFLSVQRSKIRSELGTPKAQEGDRLIYEYPTSIVEFECYDFNGFKCSDIEVRWKR